MSSQVAGYTVSKSTPLELSVDEAIMNSKKSSSFLTMLVVDVQQIRANEIAKDAYEECLQLKEYLSEHLWSEVETDGVSKVSAALDELTQALNNYEMTNETIEGGWEFVESSACCVPSY